MYFLVTSSFCHLTFCFLLFFRFNILHTLHIIHLFCLVSLYILLCALHRQYPHAMKQALSAYLIPTCHVLREKKQSRQCLHAAYAEE